jgi:predicted ThiF/HesA family dinucleotide-utilizing enzyme
MTTGYHLHHVNGVVNKMDKTRGGVFKCAAKPTHKVILNGDSHLKGLAKELQSVVTSDYEVIGIVKPGAGSNALSETVTETVKHLIKDDVMVISSGTNDQNLDNYKSTFCNFREYLTLTIHTNILVLGIPHRFDMQNSKEVNSKIFRLNRKLSKLVYSFPNTIFLRQIMITNYTQIMDCIETKVGSNKL